MIKIHGSVAKKIANDHECPVLLIFAYDPEHRDEQVITYEIQGKNIKQASRWETPERYEKRTGEPWPDDGAVYARIRRTTGEWSRWDVFKFGCAKANMFNAQIVCATEAGPPPHYWKPEENNNA
jgi:hypothetical protein